MAALKIDVKVEGEFLAAVVQQSAVIELDVLRLIEPEYFQVPSYKWLVRLLKSREWRPPVWDFLDQELQVVEDVEEHTLYRNQLWSLYSRELTFAEDASDKFRAYIAYCVVNSTTRAAYEGFSRTSRIDFLLDELDGGVRKARHVVTGRKLVATDYASDYEARMERRRQARDNPTVNPRVLTGIPGLDQQFTIRAPMLVDFMAPFKRYKSIFLNAMGFASLLQGFNVTHVTFENSEEMTKDRYDAMFSELNYDRISNLLITREERQQLDRMFEWMQSWGNRLKIIKATAEETKVSDVEETLEHLQETENWVSEVGVWDYLNIVAPSKEYREERRVQKQISWDLKRHAEKYGTPLFVGSQSNMEGATVERQGLNHRGKSIDISQALDLSIAIDQSEEEKDEGIIVLSPQFVRGGAITIPEVVLDSDIPRMVICRDLHRLWGNAERLNPYADATQLLSFA